MKGKKHPKLSIFMHAFTLMCTSEHGLGNFCNENTLRERIIASLFVGGLVYVPCCFAFSLNP